MWGHEPSEINNLKYKSTNDHSTTSSILLLFIAMLKINHNDFLLLGCAILKLDLIIKEMYLLKIVFNRNWAVGLDLVVLLKLFFFLSVSLSSGFFSLHQPIFLNKQPSLFVLWIHFIL